MSKHNSVGVIFLVVFLFASCGKENRWDCIKRTGEIVSEARYPGTFHSIRSMDNVNVILIQDTAYYVRLEAGENLMDGLTTHVTDGFLELGNGNKCSWARCYDHEVNAYVGFVQIDSLDHQGYGTISNEGVLSVDQLDITIMNNGDVDLEIDALFCSANMHQAGDLILRGEADWVELDDADDVTPTAPNNDVDVREFGDFGDLLR